MQVSISAIGSVIIVVVVRYLCSLSIGTDLYQLALRTPGIKPWSANFRKQIRQIPNFLYTARGRPHSLQRFSRRVLNFGTRFALAIFDLLATEFRVLC